MDHKRWAGRAVIQNRELSWLQFNRRVLQEADNPNNPLLERAKFLAIVTSNLDEFLQVRYTGVIEAATGEHADRRTQGEMSHVEVYRRINKTILHQQNHQYTLYEGIRGELYLEGVRMYPFFTEDEALSQREKEIFENEVRPYLKALPFEECHPRQKQLHMLVKLAKRKKSRFAVVALPATLPRVFDLSKERDVRYFIRLEDMVRHALPRLFPKEQVEHAAVFRVIRNQDFPVEEEQSRDIVPAVRAMLERRRNGHVVRLEAEERMSEEMLTLLMKRFEVPRERRYRVTGPLDLNKLMMTLYGLIDRPSLKYAPQKPLVVDALMGEDVFDRIAERDWLLYHPYHSFAPIVHLMEHAANDPTVCAIKQTLYRVSSNSPIVAALCKAAQNGKQVTVLMEAHARFDEENNLFWGERLERAGCTVLYGLPNMKVHSKITYFEREVDGEVRRCVHLGTGNYHDGTAKLYTDFGLLTSDEALCADAEAFFEKLVGSEQATMDDLITAPDRLQVTILHLIDREREHAAQGRPALIFAKMNSLSDETVMKALLDAGREGVEVRLLVRGICCLIPERLGQSENIHVCSLVGRHLEHARAFYFENGGEGEAYLSSADWMPRNLYKRVELMFPVKDEHLKNAVKRLLELQWRDTEQCRVRRADSAYVHKARSAARINAQEMLIADPDLLFESVGDS